MSRQVNVCLQCASPRVRPQGLSEGLVPGGDGMKWACQDCGFVGGGFLVSRDQVVVNPEPVYHTPGMPPPDHIRVDPTVSEEADAQVWKDLDAPVEKAKFSWEAWLAGGSLVVLVILGIVAAVFLLAGIIALIG